MKLRAAIAGLSSLPLAAFGAMHCGPSFQAVYEGDVQFEHCYAVDESATATLREKSECWREWARSYTYGQTRDRVEYALSRRDALTMTRNYPTDDSLQEAAPGGGFRKKVISAPAPTSVFAPPPQTMPEGPLDGGLGIDAEVRSVQRPRRAPGADCADTCESTWQGCRDACAAQASEASARLRSRACLACDDAHGKCMIACFAPDAGAKAAPKK